MIAPVLTKLPDDRQVRCPGCRCYLPTWRGRDEIACTSCGAVFVR